MKTTVDDVMTKEPACCTPQTTLKEVAEMMVENDCGSIPVVENLNNRKLVGMITDRDIVCRGLAKDKNPLTLTAGDCMTKPVVAASDETLLVECCRLMEENQIRRIPIVDGNGACRGVVTQAHIAKNANARRIAQVVKDISQKTETPSRVTVGVH